MKHYESLYKHYKDQSLDSVFAHFYPIDDDYERPFQLVAEGTRVISESGV